MALPRTSVLSRHLTGLFWRHPIGPRASALLALAPQLNGCGVLVSGITKSRIGLVFSLALAGLPDEAARFFGQVLGAGHGLG